MKIISLGDNLHGISKPFFLEKKMKNIITVLSAEFAKTRYRLIGPDQARSAFEHTQNAQIQIILHTCKVSSRPLFSIHTFVVSNDSVC